MSKYIDLELALNELLRLYEEDVERYGVEIRCGLKTPETFDYRRAREALSDIPTIEVSEDCISREDLLKHAYKRDGVMSVSVDSIKLAPSVVPKARSIEMLLDVTDDVVDRAVEQIRAEGEWVIDEPPSTGHGAIYTCPFCGHEEFEPINLCPACGEKMKG